MKYLQKGWKKFSNDKGGTWFYWNAVSHHMSLIKIYRKMFKKYIDKSGKILDLGAGRLFYKKEIKKFTKKYESIDIKKTHFDLDYIGTTFEAGLKESSYDVIFCSQVLEHVPDPLDNFQEINRILKKNGIAIIAVPFLMYLHNEPYDYFRYTKHSLRKFSMESNFEILELKEVGGFFGFLGGVFAMIIIGVSWRIPILNWSLYLINYIFQNSFLFLDKITQNHKIMPSNYLLVIRKR